MCILTVTSDAFGTPYPDPSCLAISRRICKSKDSDIIPYAIITTVLLISAFFLFIVSMISFLASVGSPSVRKMMTFFLEDSLPVDDPFNKSKARVKALA